MKTIAICIEESTVEALDRLVAAAGDRSMSRSRLVREALSEYLRRTEQAQREASDQAVVSRHKELLQREAESLISEQAQP